MDLDLKSLDKLTGSGANGGWTFEKVKSIINDVRSLLVEYNKIRGVNNSPISGGLPPGHSPGAGQIPPAADIKKNESADPTAALPSRVNGMNLKPILNYLIPFLEKCISENPDISIGECIALLPDKASDVLVLLQVIRGGLR